MPYGVIPPALGGMFGSSNATSTYTVVGPFAAGSAEYNTVVKDGGRIFSLKSQAQSFANTQNNQFALSTNPAKAALQLASGNATQAGQGTPATQEIPGGGTIDDAINFIKQGSIWERVVEVLGGLILLYVGLKAVTTPNGQQPVRRTFKQTASTVAKVAMK